MAAFAAQQQQQVSHVLVEEKVFPVFMERSIDALTEAIAHALGVELEPLAHGMWSARRPVDRSRYQEITIRALPTDDGGTSVEVRIEDRFKPLATALTGTLALVLCMLIVPIFFVVAKASETQRELERDRLVQMHRVWTEVTSTLGAPLRAGYRARPTRARVQADEEGSEEEPLEDEQEQASLEREA